MKTEIKENPIEKHLVPLKSESIKKTITDAYATFFNEVKAWKDTAEGMVVTDINDTEGMANCKKARLEVVKIRTGADKKRKALKSDALVYGRTVQAVYQEIEDSLKPIESKLREGEEFKKRIEAEELRKAIEYRTETLLNLNVDPDLYVLDKLNNEQFESLLNTIKLAKEAEKQAEILRIETEKKAEIERLAEKKKAEEEAEKLRIEAEEKQKAIEAENAKLRKEVEEREAIEATKRKEAEEKARKEREAIEEKARIEREALELKANQEREEKERLERELELKKEAEENAKLQEQVRQEMLNRGDDKSKFLNVADQLSKINIPDIKSEYGKELFKRISTNIEAMIKTLKEQK